MEEERRRVLGIENKVDSAWVTGGVRLSKRHGIKAEAQMQLTGISRSAMAPIPIPSLE